MTFKRRQLLKSLGLGAAAGPFIPLLNASGQEPKQPEAADPDLHARRQLGPTEYDQMETIDWLQTGTETTSRCTPMHAPLEPFKSKLVIPWGLKLSAGGAGEQPRVRDGRPVDRRRSLHDPPSRAPTSTVATATAPAGAAAPRSIRAVAQPHGTGDAAPDLAVKGPNDANQETLYRTLELGVQCGEPHSVYRMIYKADSQPLHPGNESQSGLRSSVQHARLAIPMSSPRSAREKAAVLDLVSGDIAKLRGRVSTEEHPKIDAHLEGLRALERRLDATVAARAAPRRRRPWRASASNNANFPTEVTSMLDIVAHVLGVRSHPRRERCS